MLLHNRLSFLIMFILIITLAACKQDEQIAAAPQTVVVAPVTKQFIAESITVVGQVVAKESVYLKARVEGFLIKRNFNEGAFVKKDELLFVIEQTLYKAQVAAAEAQLENNEASLKNDIIDYNRQKYLAKNDAVSKREYDKAVCSKTMSEAKVMLARANLAEEKLSLSYTEIYSPFDGRIGLAAYSVGNLVGPNSNPLAQVVMVDPIQVEFSIAESSLMTELQHKFRTINPDKSGKKASLDDIIPTLTLSNGTKYPETGRIDFIDNIINPMTGTIVLRAIFPNPKSILIPGAYVNVNLAYKEKTERLLIPQSAMQENQAGKFVLVIDKDNKVETRNFTAGDVYDIYIVVQKGLKEGELVITEGLQKVHDGMVVNPVQEKEEPDKTTEVKKTDKTVPEKGSSKETPAETDKAAADKAVNSETDNKSTANKQDKIQG